MTDKYGAQEKYQKENMKRVTIKLKKELIEEFQNNIDNDDDETSVTQFIKRHIEQYNEDKRILKTKKDTFK